MADPHSPTGEAALPHIVAANAQDEVTVDLDRWARLAGHALAAEGAVGEMTLTFIDRDEIAALKERYLGGHGPTDVLSFPLDTSDAPTIGDEPALIGDVVICPSVAHDQAPDHAGTIDDEIALLVVHGCLHLVGYDHADPAETAVMRGRERELLSEWHWNGPVPPGFRQEQD